MARTTTPLNDTQVKQAKVKAKEYSLADGYGLLLRVKPSGSKNWLFNYTHPFTKKRKNISLGLYPETTLSEARSKRSDYRALLAQGRDPKEYRDYEKNQNSQLHRQTLKVTALDWFNVKKSRIDPKTKQRKMSDQTAKKVWRSLELHLFPSLGDYPISKITAQDVLATLRKVEQASKHEVAGRVCSRLNDVMRFAVASGLIPFNPIEGLKTALASPQATHRKTIPPSELPEFMQTLKTANITAQTRFLIEWQLHTMTRPNEAASARWEDVDLENRVWTIPDHQMKMRKAHSVPLTPHTVALLSLIKMISGQHEYLFPNTRNPKSSANSQSAHRAIQRMGYMNRLDSHGLRSIASTYLNEQAFSPDLIEACLAHEVGSDVRRAYNRTNFLERRRLVMSAWSEYIEQCITGNIVGTTGNKGLRLVNE